MNTLFEDVFEKYGLAIGKMLWKSQIDALEIALNKYEQGEEAELDDPFVQVVYMMIICDLRWEQKKEGVHNEK